MSIQNIMDHAASVGDLTILKWLKENTSGTCTNEAMNFAAQNGHVHIIEWLNTNDRCKITQETIRNSIIYNRIDVLKWLCLNKKELIDLDTFIRFCIERGHCISLEIILKTYADDLIDLSVNNGQKEITENLKDFFKRY